MLFPPHLAISFRLLVRLIYILHVQDSEMTIVPEVTKSDPGARLDTKLFNDLLAEIQTDGNTEEVAIGQSAVFDDAGVRLGGLRRVRDCPIARGSRTHCSPSHSGNLCR